LSYEIGALAKHQERFFYGVSYRDWDAIIGMAGANLLKDNSLTVGYSFGYIVGGKKAKAGTSHEIMLSYRLPIPSPTLPKPIYSPRFRIN